MELYDLLDARNERIAEENERMKQDSTETGGQTKKTRKLFGEVFPQALREGKVRMLQGGIAS